MLITKILKEPLLHFLILGALLFIVYIKLNPGQENDIHTIILTDNDVEYVAGHFKQRFNRKPSKKELKEILLDYATTEAYYREAVSLGLDKNDNNIKRLLRKKMEIMSKNVLSLLDITDKKLQEYLKQHPEKFVQRKVYVFDQVQINPAKHSNLKSYIQDVKNSLNSGLHVKSDSPILQAHFSGISKRVLDGDFGENFSKELNKIEAGKWVGPIRSNFGLHFVKLDKKVTGEVPSVNNIRERLTRAYIKEKQNEILQKQRKELLDKYKVVFDINGSRK